MKIVKYFGVACLAYLVICVIIAVVQTSNDVRGLEVQQRAEARQLAGQTFVTHKDGSVTPLNPKDAEMMVETCTYLRKMRLSEMTSDMLSVLGNCREHGIGR
jgi:hypothetical protein